jgi:uncharacterized protein (DUF362 family)
MKHKLSLAVCAALPCAVLLFIAAGNREARQSETSQNSSENTNEPNADGGELTPAAPGAGKALVGIGRGADHAAVTAQAIANAGGLGSVISKGDTVIIKPNLSEPRNYNYPGGTDYRVAAEVVRLAREAGRIIIAEGSGGPGDFSAAVLRLNRYNTITGVEFLDLNKIPREDCYYVSSPKRLTNPPIYMPKIYVDADVVISVPKLKTNYAVGPSLGLKNGFGVPPKPLVNNGSAWKLGLHSRGIPESIVEINLLRKPDFVVVDGIRAGEGNGPLGNGPVDARIVFAGSDVLAVDTIAAYFMGFNPQKIPHLKLAAENGMGEYRMEYIETAGADIRAIRMDFDSPFPKD